VDLTRTLRVLGSRWPLVVALALLGAIAGWFGAGFRNDRIEPVWEASAPISLVEGAADEETQGNRAEATIEDRLTEIQELAREINRDEIDIDPSTPDIETSPERGVILVDVDGKSVNFIARGGTEDAAVARALELRQNFLDDPEQNEAKRITALRDDLASQMSGARLEIAELEVQLTDLDPNADARAELAALLDTLKTRLTGFQEELLIPDIFVRDQAQTGTEEAEPRPAGEIQADIEAVTSKIASVEAQLEALHAPPNVEFSAVQTDLRVWQDRYVDLEADYRAYSLQLLELENPVVTEAVATSDVTPLPASRGLYALVGLMAGSAVAAAGLLSGDRLRGPVWVASDAPFIPTLATVAGRGATPAPWYDEATDSRRRSEIQALRAGVLARLRERSGSVAIAGSKLDSLSVRAVAADLAMSYAQAGRSVLVVDADFDPSDGLAEFPRGGLTLAKLVVDLRAGVAPDFQAVSAVRDNMWSMSSGSFDEDPADLFAGDVLDRALEVLADRYEVVIVSAGDVTETVTQELVSRADATVVAASAGRSLSNELKLYMDEFTRRGASILGLVIVTRQAAPVFMKLRDRLLSRDPAVITPPDSSNRSDVSEPAMVVAVPAETEVAIAEGISPAEGPGTRPRERVRVADPEPRLLRRPSDAAVEVATAEILASAIGDLDPTKAYGPIADFMADITEQIILRPHEVGFDHDGMLPLHPVKDRTTVGSAIGRLLRDDLGQKEGAALERQIIEILFGSGPLKTVPVVRKSLDAWLSIAFFRVHLARAGREPQILHLVSPNRYFQIMVDAALFDRDHVARLVDEVLPMFVEDVERQQRAAHQFGSEAAMAQLDRAIVDATALGGMLSTLLAGSEPAARLHYPWADDPHPIGWKPRWEEDARATLAPLQRMGVLAVPILTEEELEYMVAAG